MQARVRVANEKANPKTLILEPWAREYPLASGAVYLIEGEGPESSPAFEVSANGDLITVWAWSGADVRVLTEDGTIIEDWTGNRVPPFPSGHSAVTARSAETTPARPLSFLGGLLDLQVLVASLKIYHGGHAIVFFAFAGFLLLVFIVGILRALVQGDWSALPVLCAPALLMAYLIRRALRQFRRDG